MLAWKKNSAHFSRVICAGALLPARVALLLIRAYKLALSPLFAGSCRFVPGCADYAAEAILRHGLLRGGWLGARRLCRCHPFGGHGYDPVPARGGRRSPAALA